MTTVDVCYRYATQPSELCTRALSSLREIYGIRKMMFDEAAKTVQIEYDSTRLDEPVVADLLRKSGLDVVERVALV